MAKSRTADKVPSMMGEFREIFKAKPRLLKIRSNEEVANLWLNNHPEYSELPPRARSSMANIKSHLKKQRRKRGRKKAEANSTPEPRPVKSRTANLNALEIHIDDCMDLARQIDRERLDNVLKLLRNARNEVILMG